VNYFAAPGDMQITVVRFIYQPQFLQDLRYNPVWVLCVHFPLLHLVFNMQNSPVSVKIHVNCIIHKVWCIYEEVVIDCGLHCVQMHNIWQRKQKDETKPVSSMRCIHINLTCKILVRTRKFVPQTTYAIFFMYYLHWTWTSNALLARPIW